MPTQLRRASARIEFERLHPDQLRAWLKLQKPRFKALRAGRRWGKSALAITWIAHGLLKGEEVAWFAPEHKHMTEPYEGLRRLLAPLIASKSKSPSHIRLANGGRIDFWSLANENAPRGRRYARVVIDEAAFAKNGGVEVGDSMMAIWKRSIEPTLIDFRGEVLVCSNTAGENPDNFFNAICTDPAHGFVEYHAKTFDNPLIPLRKPGESQADWLASREAYFADLKARVAPLVFLQEYEAEFVNWLGAAFFNIENLLVDGQPVAPPPWCDYVFAVIDTAIKTGTDNDGTAVAYFALNRHLAPYKLVVLDWDLRQIEGATLVDWLPGVYARLEELQRECRPRLGSAGAFIEDVGGGAVLLQQARQRGLLARPIQSRLTQMGKDERAFDVSGYIHQGLVKYSEGAFNKLVTYKGQTRNHLVAQVSGFRIGDTDSRRQDDALDVLLYGLAIALGNREGF